MVKEKRGAELLHDWEYFYKHSGELLPIMGDRNAKRCACQQWFDRNGFKAKVISRTIEGQAYLMVIKLKK